MSDPEIPRMHAGREIGEKKTDVYFLLNVIHEMAGSMAVADTANWRLSRTCTLTDYVFTEWTNGIIEVGAESFRNQQGEPTAHEYYLRPVSEEPGK